MLYQWYVNGISTVCQRLSIELFSAFRCCNFASSMNENENEDEDEDENEDENENENIDMRSLTYCDID